MALVLRRRLSAILLRPFSRALCDAAGDQNHAAPSPDPAQPVRYVVPLPVVPENSPWSTLTPPSKTVFPKDVDKYSIVDFLKCFHGLDIYQYRLARKCKTFRDFLLVRVKVLKKLGIPRHHRKLIIKFTHRYRMGIWKIRPPPPPQT